MAAEETSYLTIAELADRLGRSASTVRNWRRAYRDLITERVGRDGYRRYPLARFREIAMLHDRRLPSSSVRAALAEQADAEEQPSEGFESRVLGYLDRLAAADERIAAAVERIADALTPKEE